MCVRARESASVCVCSFGTRLSSEIWSLLSSLLLLSGPLFSAIRALCRVMKLRSDSGQVCQTVRYFLFECLRAAHGTLRFIPYAHKSLKVSEEAPPRWIANADKTVVLKKITAYAI